MVGLIPIETWLKIYLTFHSSQSCIMNSLGLSEIPQGEHTIQRICFTNFPQAPSWRALTLKPPHFTDTARWHESYSSWHDSYIIFTVHNFRRCSEMMRAWRGSWMWHHDLFSCKFLTSFLKYQTNDLLELPKITLHKIPSILASHSYWITYRHSSVLSVWQEQEDHASPDFYRAIWFFLLLE